MKRSYNFSIFQKNKIINFGINTQIINSQLIVEGNTMVNKVISHSKMYIQFSNYEEAVPGVPDEIWKNVFSTLTLKEFTSLNRTCKQIYSSSPYQLLMKLRAEYYRTAVIKESYCCTHQMHSIFFKGTRSK